MEMRNELKELLAMIESAEGKIILQPVRGNSRNFSIISAKDGEELPHIVFRFTEDTLVLSWIYLKYINKGTGTRIVDWLINYAKEKELDFFKIVNTKPNNIALEKISKKYKMSIPEKYDENNEYIDYVLNLKRRLIIPSRYNLYTLCITIWTLNISTFYKSV